MAAAVSKGKGKGNVRGRDVQKRGRTPEKRDKSTSRVLWKNGACLECGAAEHKTHQCDKCIAKKTNWENGSHPKGYMGAAYDDATKAYFNATPKRHLFVRPSPKELGLPPGTMGKLVRRAYMTRNAGALREEHYAGTLMEMCSLTRKAEPTCFYHPKLDIAVVVHGGDFVALGDDAALTIYENWLRRAFELGDCVRLGMGPIMCANCAP